MSARGKVQEVPEQSVAPLGVAVLSDHLRNVSEEYGILIKNLGVSSSATTGADTACSRLAHKSP